ncbi:MAG: hypothetical protein ABI400_01960 [Lacisediminihabitans sp.]
MRIRRIVACAVAAALLVALAGCAHLPQNVQKNNLAAIAKLPGIVSLADVHFSTTCGALCSAVSATLVLDNSLSPEDIRQLRDRIRDGLVTNHVPYAALVLRQGSATIPLDAEDSLFDLWDRARADPRFAAVELVRDEDRAADVPVFQLSVHSKSDLVAALAAGMEMAPPSISLSLRVTTMSHSYSVLAREGDDVETFAAVTSELEKNPSLTGFTVRMGSKLGISLDLPALAMVPDVVTTITAALSAVPSAEHPSLLISTPGTFIHMDAFTEQDLPAVAAVWAIIGSGVIPESISILQVGEDGAVEVFANTLEDAQVLNSLLETHPKFRELSEYAVSAKTKDRIRTFSFGEERLPAER